MCDGHRFVLVGRYKSVLLVFLKGAGVPVYRCPGIFDAHVQYWG